MWLSFYSIYLSTCLVILKFYFSHYQCACRVGFAKNLCAAGKAFTATKTLVAPHWWADRKSETDVEYGINGSIFQIQVRFSFAKLHALAVRSGLCMSVQSSHGNCLHQGLCYEHIITFKIVFGKFIPEFFLPSSYSFKWTTTIYSYEYPNFLYPV